VGANPQNGSPPRHRSSRIPCRSDASNTHPGAAPGWAGMVALPLPIDRRRTPDSAFLEINGTVDLVSKDSSFERSPLC
jgi:hypothetical protein